MAQYTSRLAQGFVAIAILSGCNSGEMPATNSQNAQQIAVSGALASIPSCATVLLPLPSGDAEQPGSTDRSILSFQAAVFRVSQPQHQLERLGWTFVTKARESRDAGYYKLAEQVALCMDSTTPDTPGSLLLRGHVLHNLHRFKEAEALARRLVAQRGLWFDFALLGDVLMERGVLPEAIDAYQRVIDQRPGPQAYARISQLRWLRGDLDGALEMMVTAVRATSSRTTEPAAWAHVRLALLLMQIGELSATDAALDRALYLQPDYSPALHLKGRLRLAQNRLPEALQLLNRSVQLDPQPEYRWTLYEALRKAAQVSAAAEQKSALMDRGTREDRRSFALYLANLGEEPERAVRLALQELELRHDVFTLDAVAWALAGAGRHQEAIEYSRRALAEGTQDARLYFHAGVIAAHAGDEQKAIELLRRADAMQLMLLPSEQQRLAEEFAALQPQIPTLAEECSTRQERCVF